MKRGALRIPPEATTRLLNSLKPSPPVEEDEGALRRAEEDGMDVDSQLQPQAGTSTDTGEQKQEVTGIQLYDGSKSPVCFPPSPVPPRFLKVLGLCVWLESHRHEYSGNWVSPPRHLKPPRSRVDGNSGQRMPLYISGTYRLALRMHPQSHHSHFHTSPTKTNGISPVWIGAQMGNSWRPARLMGVCDCAHHLQNSTWEMISSRLVYNTSIVRTSG